jgi:hypothetical protein
MGDGLGKLSGIAGRLYLKRDDSLFAHWVV